MGLLYLFPTSIDEKDYVTVLPQNNEIKAIIKTYGLPWIFWLYSAAAILVLLTLSFIITTPLLKLYSMATWVDRLLITSLFITLALTFLSILVFLYWRTYLVIGNDFIQVESRPFGLKIGSKKIPRSNDLRIEIKHFLDSPNMARINTTEEYKSFQNKGYFELVAEDNHQQLLIDRSSRKPDLEDLQKILNHFIQK